MKATQSDPYLDRVWIRCDMCDDFWCTRHEKHVHDCDCPSIEEWIEPAVKESDSHSIDN
jgi:hypothetical protein